MKEKMTRMSITLYLHSLYTMVDIFIVYARGYGKGEGVRTSGAPSPPVRTLQGRRDDLLSWTSDLWKQNLKYIPHFL